MRERRRRSAALLSILAGALLAAGHFSGAPHWVSFLELVARFIPMNLVLRGVFVAVLVVASFGGIAVILGGLLILGRRDLLAKLLILLGTGFGLVSFVVAISLAVYRGDLPVYGGNALIVIAIGMSVAARVILREPRTSRKRR